MPPDVTVDFQAGQNVINARMGKVPQCDFCTEPADPDIVYQATGETKMGDIPGWEMWSDDQWGACPACAAIIDDESVPLEQRKERLARRASALFDKVISKRFGTAALNRMPASTRLAQVRLGHEAFWGTKKP
jgi:hypothetical protein